MAEPKLSASLEFSYIPTQELRYGENPHQSAILALDPKMRGSRAASAHQIHGKRPSATNFLDMDAGLELVRELTRPSCAIIKHTNPCGFGVSESIVEAYRLAQDSELKGVSHYGAISRYGGVIACSYQIDAYTARRITEKGSFYEAIIAPDFTSEACAILQSRAGWGQDLILLVTGPLFDLHDTPLTEIKPITGGAIIQDSDRVWPDFEQCEVATDRAPTPDELKEMQVAWAVVRRAKSNAVVLVKGGQMIGLGAGQTNRLVSTDLAIKMAGYRAKGSVCASDAFFPFDDASLMLVEAGVTAIAQPGGSKRDDETVAVCNQHGIAMIYTRLRAFRH